MAITEAPAAGPPRWAADLEDRFDVRWFDGVRWTQHAAIQGVQGSSPPGLAPEQTAVLVTQLIDLLPAPRPPLPSAWGPIPPPPMHVPFASMPPTQGWQPDLANARPLTAGERAAAIQAAIRQRGASPARDRCPMHWRILARFVDNALWLAAGIASVLVVAFGMRELAAELFAVQSLAGLGQVALGSPTAVLGAGLPVLLLATLSVMSVMTAMEGQTVGQRMLRIHAVDVGTGRRVGVVRFVLYRGLVTLVMLYGLIQG